jgi:hypothetical protein
MSETIEALTWRDLLRWGGIIGPVVALAFWLGAQLTAIQSDVQSVRAEVGTMRASVSAAVVRLEQQDRRLWVLEQRK